MESKVIVRRGNARLEIENAIKRFSNGRVRTGILRGNDAHGKTTVGEIATIHEFGAPGAGIPQRSFLWLGTQIAKPAMQKLLKRIAIDMRKGHMTEQAGLRMIGELLQKGMQQTFKDWQSNWAPIAPSTIESKGHTEPLIDTRQLYEAINYEVDNPKGVK